MPGNPGSRHFLLGGGFGFLVDSRGFCDNEKHNHSVFPSVEFEELGQEGGGGMKDLLARVFSRMVWNG